MQQMTLLEMSGDLTTESEEPTGSNCISFWLHIPKYSSFLSSRRLLFPDSDFYSFLLGGLGR